MIRVLIAGFFFAAVSAVQAGVSTPSPQAAATIVVYNRNDPASTALAKYYAGRRNIPDAQLVGLDCSSKEEISRDDYLVDIQAPLRNAFTQHGWWKVSNDDEGHRLVVAASIRFVAIMRGVPMKILPGPKPTPAPGAPPDTTEQMLARHDEASVDSELAALFVLSDETGSLIPNSYYRRFAHILDLPAAGSPLLVCRLDGLNDAVVRRMIDDAIATEKSGLWGWAYLDARNIKDPGYIEGDDWLTRAGDSMRLHGIPVISDYAPEILPEGYPVTNAAVYYGWYTNNIAGPFAKHDFKFLPGAVAVHLHSGSASTVRFPEMGWTGPLVLHGAAASMGNVFEPFLTFTVNFDILQDRLMGGFTLAESAYAATRGLSWMNVVLGDPLYRPYAAWNDFEQEDAGPPNIWQRYRNIVLKADGGPLDAADALRKLAIDAGSSMPLEALGQAQGAAQQFDLAIRTLGEAAKLEKSKTIRFRIALEQIELLRRDGRTDDALKRISDTLGDFTSEEQQATLGQIVLAIRPPPAKPEKK